MKEWEKIIEQKPSEAHEKQVLASMESLLDQNAELAKHVKEARGIGWIFWFAPALSAAAAIAFFLLTGSPFRGESKPEPGLAATPMLEIAMEYELLSDLQEIRHLDELQKLEGSQEWKSRKSGTRKL